LDHIWNGDANLAMIIAEKEDSVLGSNAIMSIQELLEPLNGQVIVRLANIDQESVKVLFEDRGVSISQQSLIVIAVRKSIPTANADIVYEGADVASEATLHELTSGLRHFIKSSLGRSQQSVVEDLHKIPEEEAKHGDKEVLDVIHAVTREEDIKQRRYTAYMSDLENAILYSLSHEIGTHAIVAGQALVALQEYVDVLAKHFPGRPETMGFLHKLRNWVASHTDAIRGDDLIDEINDIRASTGSFTDTPNGAWIGCKGTKPFYGGYPCSLWTLWHVLTVNQNHEQIPDRVLQTMLGYVKHFFGCRDCARHFLLEADDGKAITKEVTDKDTSILWLWRAHNRANVRLSGDVTDDKAFPKEVFPNRQHCSDCYNSRMGSDLWSEFNHDRVSAFLNDLYSNDYLNDHGLKYRAQRHRQPHDITIYKVTEDKDESSMHNNYSRQSNNSNAYFWGPMDMSLCFSIYILSAVILLFVYFKFIAKRKIWSACAHLLPGQRKMNSSMSGII
jgi:hypothetical protein